MNSVDPKELFKKQVAQALIGALILPALVLVGFLVLLFILSYTELLGGPYGIAKFFFWFLTVIYSTVGYVIFMISQDTKKNRNKSKEKSSGQVFRDAEVVEK